MSALNQELTLLSSSVPYPLLILTLRCDANISKAMITATISTLITPEEIDEGLAIVASIMLNTARSYLYYAPLLDVRSSLFCGPP